MTTLVEGHRYLMDNFEDPHSGQEIQFIHKVPVNSDVPGELKTLSDGTTNEEVLAVLIDRMNYLQDKFPCTENEMVIKSLDFALLTLNKRTADRKARNVEGKHLS